MNNPETIPDIIKDIAEKKPKTILFYKRQKNFWEKITAKRFYSDNLDLAKGLSKIGIKNNERVGIISWTRYEWELAEKGILTLGAVAVGINPLDSTSEIKNIIKKTNIQTIIVENKKLFEKIPKINNLKIISIDKFSNKIETISQLINKGKKEKHIRFSVNKNDPAIIIFTSGTTGESKGIMYRHKHLTNACFEISKILKEYKKDGDTTISWLPLVYMTGKILNLVAINLGIQTYFVQNPRKIIEEVQKINPDYMMGVPRFYEKIYDEVNERIKNQFFYIRIPIKLLIKINSNINNRYLRKISLFPLSIIKNKIVGKNIRFMISGAAPIDKTILKFFYGLGILIIEGYAMSENAIPVSLNTPTKFKFGTVGTLLDANKIKFAKDNEILIKGSGLFEGYLDDKKNKNLFTKAGYFKTGDLGELGKKGFLTLISRKKDIIKTSTGLRISPAQIEKIYKKIPFIEDIVVVGERKKHISALITLNKKNVINFLKENEIKYNPEKLFISIPVKKLIERELKDLHSELADHKQIKKFYILNNNFSIKTGEINKGLKLKRDFIEEKYKEEIDNIYMS